MSVWIHLCPLVVKLWYLSRVWFWFCAVGAWSFRIFFPSMKVVLCYALCCIGPESICISHLMSIIYPWQCIYSGPNVSCKIYPLYFPLIYLKWLKICDDWYPVQTICFSSWYVITSQPNSVEVNLAMFTLPLYTYLDWSRLELHAPRIPGDWF